MYKVKTDTCPICGKFYTIKYSDMFEVPFAVLEVPESCRHEHIIRARYVDVKIVKKNKGLT